MIGKRALKIDTIWVCIKKRFTLSNLIYNKHYSTLQKNELYNGLRMLRFYAVAAASPRWLQKHATPALSRRHQYWSHKWRRKWSKHETPIGFVFYCKSSRKHEQFSIRSRHRDEWNTKPDWGWEFEFTVTSISRHFWEYGNEQQADQTKDWSSDIKRWQ